MDPHSLNLPVVRLTDEAGEWADYYELGSQLDRQFPDQDAIDFVYACHYNDWGPLASGERGLRELVMLQQGANDSAPWHWEVVLDDSSRWSMRGSCDYTGWDCQSSNSWAQISSLPQRPAGDIRDVLYELLVALSKGRLDEALIETCLLYGVRL